MKLGVSVGANSVGANPAGLRALAQAAERAGYTRFVLADHVLGADPSAHESWQGYTHEHLWHEPFVALGYLAAITERIELMTGVVILPQRQTALVAKQAAEVDVLSGGRFVLGAGTGWNAVEYEALGRDFHTRGRQMDEQIELLRRLWREPVVSIRGRWHTITAAGLNPLPAKRDIPIWLGGTAERALDRVGQSADGWYSLQDDPGQVAAGVARIRAAATAAGRAPADIGIQARVVAGAPTAGLVARAQAFRDAGATHLMVGTQPGVLDTARHIAAIEEFAMACRDARLAG